MARDRIGKEEGPGSIAPLVDVDSLPKETGDAVQHPPLDYFSTQKIVRLLAIIVLRRILGHRHLHNPLLLA